MNTKSKKTKQEFQDLLGFQTKEEKIEHRSKMIMFNFLDIVEKEMINRKMSKKELAEKLNTSASFVTQLFTGTKTINLLTIAKLEQIFDIKFQITKTHNKKMKTRKSLNKTSGGKQVITA
jgi:ribosome-binding protein aMBF1 (putative translation factor)